MPQLSFLTVLWFVRDSYRWAAGRRVELASPKHGSRQVATGTPQPVLAQGGVVRKARACQPGAYAVMTDICKQALSASPAVQRVGNLFRNAALPLLLVIAILVGFPSGATLALGVYSGAPGKPGDAHITVSK